MSDICWNTPFQHDGETEDAWQPDMVSPLPNPDSPRVEGLGWWQDLDDNFNFIGSKQLELQSNSPDTFPFDVVTGNLGISDVVASEPSELDPAPLGFAENEEPENLNSIVNGVHNDVEVEAEAASAFISGEAVVPLGFAENEEPENLDSFVNGVYNDVEVEAEAASAFISGEAVAAVSVAGPGLDVTKVDNRGKHWKSKVAQGHAPTPWKGNQSWCALKKAMELHFNPMALPWNFKNQRKSGSASKVIFMELLRNRGAGVVELTGGEGFYGIASFLVPADQRAAFDAGAVPSAGSQEGGSRKKFAKIWETAGFRERRLWDGGLEYIYDEALYQKQKAQQT